VAPAAERVVAILAEGRLHAVRRREPRKPQGWWNTNSLGAAR
jgi:hypothetical protein